MSGHTRWPLGHQYPAGDIAIQTFADPHLQASVDLAERHADRTQRDRDQARLSDASQAERDRLSILASRARHRYYAALNADLAP